MANLPHKEIEIDELNCSICQHEYGDNERNPRTLSCGHTFCTTCLRNILDEEYPLCPDCRSHVRYLSVNSIPVCFIVKKILESVSALNRLKLKNGEKASNVQNSLSRGNLVAHGQLRNLKKTENTASRMLFSLGECLDHNAPQHFLCSTCHLVLCGSCVLLKHNKSKAEGEKCVVVQCSESVKLELIRNLHTKISNQIQIAMNVSRFLNRINMKVAQHQIQVNEHRLIPLMHQITSKLNDKICDIDDDLDTLNDVRSRLKNAKNAELGEITEFINNIWECERYPKFEEDFLSHLWISFIDKNQKFYPALKNLGITFIFTSQVNGKKCYSDVRFGPDSMMVDSLNPHYKRSPEQIVFHLSDLFFENMHTFMEFEVDGSYLGFIIIKLIESERAVHFRKLCTGEMGPSYKGTEFINSGGTYNVFLSGGDYQNNNGTGGSRLYQFEDDGDCYSLNDGSICGNHINAVNTLGQFKIFYNTCAGSIARGLFGHVVYGLDLVETIATNGYYIDNVFVKECGLYFYNL